MPINFIKKLNLNSSINNILRNIGWLLSEKIINIIIGVGVSIMLARYLGPEDFGVLNFLLAAVALIGPIASLGLNGILTKELLNSPEKEGQIFATAILFRTLSGVIALVVLLIVFQFAFVEKQSLFPLVLVVGMAQTLMSFSALRFWFEAKVLSKYLVKYSVFVSIISALAKGLTVYVNGTLEIIVWITAAEMAANALILLIPYAHHSGKLRHWSLNFTLGKELVKRSWWLTLSGVAAIVYMKIDQIMLGKMIGSAEVGIYAVAARFSEVWYFVPLAIMSSLFPSLIKAKKIGKDLYEARMQTFFDLLFWVAFLIALFMTFISTPFILFLYGEDYVASANILSIHIWAGLFVFMRAALSKWLIAENLMAFSLVTHGAGAIINVLANFVLIPIYAGDGAAIATLISYATASWLSLFIYPKTRFIGTMMFKAIFAPYRVLLNYR
jgi:PST family polysaccharide transporter